MLVAVCLKIREIIGGGPMMGKALLINTDVPMRKAVPAS